MKAPTITLIKKYLLSLKKIKKKYVTSEILSKSLGVYPEVINETLSFFDPMVNMDYQYDIKTLIPLMEDFISENETHKSANTPLVRVSRKDVLEYSSIGDFIYKKMTIGGIIDKNVRLSDSELHLLKKLVVNEINERKPKKKKRK